MKTTSYKVGTALFLVVLSPEGEKPVPVPTPTDHVLCVDVSGSMSSELSIVRAHSKEKLTKLVRKGDTFSMVWFSGRGQHGVLFEGEPVSTLVDLQQIKDAIDKFLIPVGMTGFKEPLGDVAALLKRLRVKRPDALANLVFMSDGCDNQWSLNENLEALNALKGIVDGATFVEYGYYADRKMLTTMAETLGGSVVFAEDFPGYQPVVERALQGMPSRSMAKVGLVKPMDDFAFGLHDGAIRAFKVDGSTVLVPSDGELEFDVCYLSKTAHGEVLDLRTATTSHAYTAMAAYAHRMRGDVVREIGSALGDVVFCEKFATCFGKQKFSDFAESALEAAVDQTRRFQRGRDLEFKPSRSSLTVIDFFEILSAVNATAMIEHALFKYDRISRKSFDDTTNGLRFAASSKEGCAITSIVLNENRPNISFKLKKNGVVALGHVKDKPKGLPTEIQTFQWRNYAVVADAIVHIDLFPVQVTPAGYKTLTEHPRWSDMPVHGVSDDGDAVNLMFDLRKLGLTNLNETEGLLYENLANLEIDLLVARAEQKVYKAYAEEVASTGSDFVSGIYTPEQSLWLAQNGFGKNGFSPKKKLQEANDVYKGIELQTKIKSFSSLPTVEEVKKRISEKKKLTPSMELMRSTVELCEKNKKAMKPPVYKKWVDGMSEGAIAVARHCLMTVARTKFAVVVGQTWFVDAPVAGEAEAKVLRSGGMTFEVSSKLVEVDVEV